MRRTHRLFPSFASRAAPLGTLLTATLMALAAVVVMRGVALAQNSGATAVVSATGAHVTSELAQPIDEALMRSLAEELGIDSPIVSQADLDEIQLTLGCEGQTRACLSQVARTLSAETLVIRRLRADDGGITTLELSLLRASEGREPRVVQVTADAGARTTLAHAVPGLIQKLFGLSDAAGSSNDATNANAVPTRGQAGDHTARASDDPSDAPYAQPSTGPSVRPLTWAALITGTLTLGVGVVLGVSAQSSFDEFKATPVRSSGDAERLSRDYESIETRATMANLLMPVGGAVLGLGAVLLWLDLSEDEPEELGANAAPAVSLSPSPSGLFATFTSSFEGG